jgi:hypothetical protein
MLEKKLIFTLGISLFYKNSYSNLGNLDKFGTD